ncbi:MAG: isochorismatase hydrolase [Frankiales bacterium]|nr:isochorismatase hydrolase [Frankiales bacterium]
MTTRVWDQFLTENDRAHLARMKPKRPYGFGNKAAILSVDNYRGAIGDRPQPLLEAIEEWPNSAGLAGWAALEKVEALLAAGRAAGLPVIHLTGMAVEDTGIPGWSARRGSRGAGSRDAAAADRHSRRYDIVEQAAPLPGEVVLTKTGPSAFFGTPLLAYLVSEKIDTLIVCGEAVSGCVRATVVDGCSNRLNMIVVEDAVYDRHEATRAMNLFDIDQKYGDVISLDQVLRHLEGAASQSEAPDPDQANRHDHGSHHGHSHDHGDDDHGHGHDEDHDHSHHSVIGAPGPDSPGGATFHIPAAVLALLPPDAQPISVSEHPIHGHVVRQAGESVVEAATEAMSAGFGQTPHVIVPLRGNGETDVDEVLTAAIAQTDGGVLLIGVGYQEAATTPRSGTPDPGPCPECGSPDAQVASVIAPSQNRGYERGAVLFVCDSCGAAWDLEPAR